MKNRDRFCIVLMLLLLGGCLPKQRLVDLPMAENIRRTSDGRIFVTSRDALFELQRDDAGVVSADVVSDAGQCAFYHGIAHLLTETAGISAQGGNRVLRVR